MNDDLLRAFDAEWRTGDRAVAKQLAIAYVAAHPELRERFRNSDIGEIVSYIDTMRRTNDELSRIEADVYLLALHEPQAITGKMGA